MAGGPVYGAGMASPTGPVPVDPDDPEFWNWDGDDDDDEGPGRRNYVRTAVVVILVVGLIVLLMASL
jgi:hypothetical protein